MNKKTTITSLTMQWQDGISMCVSISSRQVKVNVSGTFLSIHNIPINDLPLIYKVVLWFALWDQFMHERLTITSVVSEMPFDLNNIDISSCVVN